MGIEYMNTSDNIDEFILALRDLNEIIEKRAKINLLDYAVLSESFYKEILNILFSWELKNLNIEQSNFEAIDLIDSNKRVVVQVSCTCENQKIHSTISKKELLKDDYKGFELYFIFVGKQNSNVKKGKYTVSINDVVEKIDEGFDALVTISMWNSYTSEAKKYALENQFGLFTFREFMGALNFLDPSQYYTGIDEKDGKRLYGERGYKFD